MPDAVVRAKDLTKKYGQQCALDGVDLEVTPGEIFGLVGPNGAGKTTTMKVLATLVGPDGGRAEVMGHDVVSEAATVRSRLGYVPQELVADRTLTARENLRLFSDLYHVPRARRAERIESLLGLVQLEEAADRLVREFSGGMRKKLDLACGLLHEPPVMLLDEPSLGLDVHARRALWDHLREVAARGIALVVSTNSMEEADTLCHRLAIVDHGRVVRAGTPARLKASLGGNVIELGFLRAEDVPPDLPTRLNELGLVKRVLVDGARVDVTVDSHERALPPVLEASREAGAEVMQASYMRPSLEAVFLDATGRHYRAAAVEVDA